MVISLLWVQPQGPLLVSGMYYVYLILFWSSFCLPPFGPLLALFPTRHSSSANPTYLLLQLHSSDAQSSRTQGHLVPQPYALIPTLFPTACLCLPLTYRSPKCLFSSPLYSQNRHNAQWALKCLFTGYELKYEWISELTNSGNNCTALLRANGKRRNRKEGYFRLMTGLISRW